MGKRIPVVTPFSLLPLWTGALPADMNARLIAHLTDPSWFWTEFPIATVAVNDPAFAQPRCGGVPPGRTSTISSSKHWNGLDAGTLRLNCGKRHSICSCSIATCTSIITRSRRNVRRMPRRSLDGAQPSYYSNIWPSPTPVVAQVRQTLMNNPGANAAQGSQGWCVDDDRLIPGQQSGVIPWKQIGRLWRRD